MKKEAEMEKEKLEVKNVGEVITTTKSIDGIERGEKYVLKNHTYHHYQKNGGTFDTRNRKVTVSGFLLDKDGKHLVVFWFLFKRKRVIDTSYVPMFLARIS
jgi:hypothetical protein